MGAAFTFGIKPMSDAFDPETGPPPDAEQGGPPGGGEGPGGPPPGGGPILASIARQQMGPQPTAPGPGNMAQGISLLNQAHGFLAQAVAMFPPGSPQSKDVLDAMKRLGRHMSQTAPTAGVQMTQMGDMMRGITRNAVLQNIMQRLGQGGSQGGPPQAMGGGGAPPPSAPLPGS